MTSRSFHVWSSARDSRLNEVEAAHATIGGLGPGRRYALQQINHAYVVLLAAEFQGFCRDLHGEAVDALVAHVAVGSGVSAGAVLRRNLVEGLKLDRGNPSPSNLGGDFGRFGFAFIDVVKHHDTRNARRLEKLNGEMLAWRSAIVHQDFEKDERRDWVQKHGQLQLKTVRGWRSTCRELARSFDDVVSARIRSLTGTAPW